MLAAVVAAIAEPRRSDIAVEVTGMWAWLLGEWRTLGFVAASTAAIYLSTEDLLSHLRRHDIHAFDEAEAMVYEPRGAISVLRKRGSPVAPALLTGVAQPPERRQNA